MKNNYNGLIPEFKTPAEAIKFLHIPKKRKCGICKGAKEQNNGNSFFCNSCLEKRFEQRKKMWSLKKPSVLSK